MPTKALLAYRESVCALAGPVAEAKYSRTVFDFSEAAEDEVFANDGSIVASQDAPGTDIHTVKTFAEAMHRRSPLVSRLIRKWTTFTIELIEIPKVWNCIEELAEILLRQGTVRAGRRLNAIVESIFDSANKLPKWSQRDDALRNQQRALSGSVCFGFYSHSCQRRSFPSLKS